MAKRRRAQTPEDLVDQGAADAHSDVRDEAQAALRKQLLALNPDAQIHSYEDALQRAGGILLPSLAMRYIFHQDTLPFGRVLTLSGLYRSNKTALAIEITRWILHHAGIGYYVDVERKDSPDMRAAILRHDPALIRYMQSIPCDTQEQWQAAATSAIIAGSNLIQKRGIWAPLGIIVDSVAAAKPKKEVEQFVSEKGGAGARGYATIALLNSDWLTQVVHRVASGPFLMMLIQHSSEQPVDGIPGATQRKQKGGAEIGFAKTMALEMSRYKDVKETLERGGVLIDIKCTKNSLGPTSRSVLVPAYWCWDAAGTQHYMWDWHAAAISLLLGFETRVKTTWHAITDICDLHGMSRGRVWSKTLGIPKDAPVTLRQAGEILEYEHPELLPDLYKVLHITQRPRMLPGESLADVWNGKIGVRPPVAPTMYPRSGTGPFADEELSDDDE